MEELEKLAKLGKKARKTARRDIAHVVSILQPSYYVHLGCAAANIPILSFHNLIVPKFDCIVMEVLDTVRKFI